ncbi:MAG TPA: cache domain-containing protein [Anaerolineae bacterium]|nr:cache domain-containing protein [Anaerolineae bacterium]
MSRGAVRFGWIAILFLIVSCASTPTPSPHITPLPTRMEPADAAQNALAQVLSELDHDLTQARSLLVYLSNQSQVRSGSASDCNEFVTPLLKANPQYTQIVVAKQNGDLFCASGTNPTGINVQDRLYFNRVLTTHDFSVGGYQVGRLSGQPSLGLAYPVLENGSEVTGVIIAPFSLDWLAGRVSEVDIPVTGEIILLDTTGNIVLRDPDATNWYGKNISQTPLANAMLTKIQGSGEFLGADGEPRIYVFGSPPTSNKQLLVAVGIPK